MSQNVNVLNKIIEQNLFEHYCQPIFDLKADKQTGGELLLRTQFGAPDIIFKNAKKNNQLYELDTKSIINAIDSASALQGQLLFVNVFPSTVKNPSFIPFIEGLLDRKEINCENIVFELNEAEKVNDMGLLLNEINRLREYGFQIALDDIGKGPMGVTFILELNVNFIKLDRRFSRKLIESTKKQDWIKAVLYYCRLNNIKVILEGIENKETLDLAKRLGVDMGQGFYLGMPKKMNIDKKNTLV